MLLFAISADLAYPIFINSNEKFASVFIKGFTKSDAMGPTFTNPATDWKIVMHQ